MFTNTRPGMFADLNPEQPVSRSFEVHNLQYSGEIILATRWQADWGMPLVADDRRFRIVDHGCRCGVSSQVGRITRSRIAVLYPAVLGEDAIRAATEYLEVDLT